MASPTLEVISLQGSRLDLPQCHLHLRLPVCTVPRLKTRLVRLEAMISARRAVRSTMVLTRLRPLQRQEDSQEVSLVKAQRRRCRLQCLLVQLR